MDLQQHHEFITATDRKNLRTQLKYLVDTAMSAYRDKKEEEHVRIQREEEEKLRKYEDEYRERVRKWFEDSVKTRQQTLVDIKLQRENEVKEFVRQKKIQQNINNCVEIREALRKRNLMEIQKCQLVQIEENKQKLLAERAEDTFWLGVERNVFANTDKKQNTEDNLKNSLIRYTKHIVDKQNDEICKNARQREVLAIKERHEAMQQDHLYWKIEEEKKKEDTTLKAEEYRHNLRLISKQQKELDIDKLDFEHKFKEAISAQRKREEALIEAKRNHLKDATEHYLNYLKDFKNKTQVEKYEDDKLVQNYERKIQCEKYARELRAKEKYREEVAKAHEELLQQMCEKKERELAELQAYNEKDINKSIVLADRPQVDPKLNALHRKTEYEEQLAQIRKQKLAEHEVFLADLRRAEAEDRQCLELAENYVANNIEFLPVHPNWQLISCECKEPQ